MFLMSTLSILSPDFLHLGLPVHRESTYSRHSAFQMKRRRPLRLVPNARGSGGNSQRKKKKTWWQKLFDEEDTESWFGVNEKDTMEDINGESDSEPSEEEKFEAWRKRAEVITELREVEEDAGSSDSANGHVWEDWLLEESSPAVESSSTSSSSSSSWDYDLQEEGRKREEPDIAGVGSRSSEEQFAGAVKNLLFRSYDDELLFEDKVFRYASVKSAKFLALLVFVPWTIDFAVHDYVLMPFLERYVSKVPLAAQVFDVRRSQKLEMIKALKVEKARFRFEVEIGKAPPLSDEEVWLELREKAIELRDEWRLENRKSFANIWSDMAYGIALFLLMYFNPNKVALLKFTGYKIINNISDTGKAFLIILITDIFLGYHSESGWEALVEAILEHYGIQVDEVAVTVFVCFVPVVIDACVKLWLFKILPRMSPNVANIFREMKRH